MEEKLITIKELANFLGVKNSWLRSKIFKNEIPYVKIGHHIRFRPEDIKSFIQKNIKGTSPP